MARAKVNRATASQRHELALAHAASKDEDGTVAAQECLREEAGRDCRCLEVTDFRSGARLRHADGPRECPF
jgi:hypothetical protein